MEEGGREIREGRREVKKEGKALPRKETQDSHYITDKELNHLGRNGELEKKNIEENRI